MLNYSYDYIIKFDRIFFIYEKNKILYCIVKKHI